MESLKSKAGRQEGHGRGNERGLDRIGRSKGRETEQQNEHSMCLLVCQVGMYTPQDRIDQVGYASKITDELFTYFEDYFQIEYSLPKCGKPVRSLFLGCPLLFSFFCMMTSFTLTYCS